MRIGFDLDGVILNNTLLKAQKLKEIYGTSMEEWKLSSNLIDIYLPDKSMRHTIGKMAGMSQNDCFMDSDCPRVLKALSDDGHELYLVSRRGKSNAGAESANQSIINLDVKQYFKECFYCETEEEKIEKIVQLDIKIFFDDRSEMIDGLLGRIEMPMLFDPFETVKQGLIGKDKDYVVVVNFAQIEEKVALSNVDSFIQKTFKNSNNCQLISNASNIVYRFEVNNQGFYFKLYKNDEYRHRDSEIFLNQMLRDSDEKRLNLSYLKRMMQHGFYQKYEYAVFEEVEGELLADMLDTGKKLDYQMIVDAFMDFSNRLFEIKMDGYGKLGEQQKFFEKFFQPYVQASLDTLSKCEDTKKYIALFELLLDKYMFFLATGESGVVSMDNNFRNIMITKERVVFIDPGAIVLGPKEMGYGEFSAHAYGTPLYDAFVKRTGADGEEQKKIRIFAVFSLLNIMAFLVRQGVKEPSKMRPFGNMYTFGTLIEKHLEFIRR